MTRRRLIPACLIAAVTCAAAATAISVPHVAPRPNEWALIMSVTVNDRTDDYVIDHDLTLPDCFVALGGLHPYHSHYTDLNDTSVHVTYACDLR